MLENQGGLLLTALIIGVAGFLANYFLKKDLQWNQANGPFSFLGFPLGSGVVGLALTTVLSIALTIACFWQASFFTFFPGINVAFETGGIAVLWIRFLQRKEA